MDILCTLVRIKGANCNVVSVKSSKPIEKKLWIDCSRALSRIYVGAPIKIGDVICKNILNTGVDIICTKNVELQPLSILAIYYLIKDYNVEQNHKK